MQPIRRDLYNSRRTMMNHRYYKEGSQLKESVRASIQLTLGLVLILALGPLVARASTVAPPSQGQSLNPVTVPAGGTATLTVRGFCIDFGKPFPTGNMTTNGLAQDNVRAAINYSIQKGYTEGNPAQVELAVWFLRDNIWHNTDNAVAQEIANNATTANTPPTTGDGTSLDDAVKQNKVTLQATFVAQTAGHYYGDVTIQIKNTGTADLKVYMPVGTLFTVPNGAGKFQDLAAYALGPQGTAQAAPSTATSEPATATTAPTETAAATAPAAAAPTDTAVVAAPTSTEVATVAAAPTEMPTATQVSSTLPQTGSPGGPSALGDGFGAAIAVAAVMFMILGFAIRLKLSRRNVTRRR
jgi:hypothetical protein